MRASVLTTRVDVEPGEPVEIRLEVVNTLDIVDLIALDVPGLSADEFQFDRPTVSLFPDEAAQVQLTLRLRRTFPAGLGRIDVRIASTLRPDLVEIRPIEVDVAPFTEAELVVRPKTITAKRTATIMATVVNTGNTPVRASLLARDDERHLRWELTPTAVTVPPESEAVVVIHGEGRRPFFGAPAYRTVYISAQYEEGPLDETVALSQKPIIVRGLLTAALLALIVALWALIVTYGVRFVLDEETPNKAVPENFASPVSFGDLAEAGPAAAAARSPEARAAVAAVVGTVSGTVVGQDSGEPIPRLAVEAHRRSRRRPDAVLGTDDTLVQSAATDESGAFTLESLFPGTYFLKFVDAQFRESWYPGVPTAAEALGVELGPAGSVELDEARVAGLPGSIVGSIDTGGEVVALTVTARPLVDDVPGLALPDVVPVYVDADGDGIPEDARYEIPDLASPLTYSITVSSDEFADQVIEERLDAGARLEASPVRLAPGDGDVTGLITLVGTPPDEGVTVTATQGDTSFTVTTPTPVATATGATVSFRLSNLPTPGTFGLTFEVAGYETAVSSVDLQAGAAADVGTIVLSGGSRTFGGTVCAFFGTRPAGGSSCDPALDGLRLGDVLVSVQTPTRLIETRTLPAPSTPGTGSADCRTPPPVPAYDPASGAGTFVLEELPLGLASITFSKEGFRSVTHRIDVTGDGPPIALTAGIVDGVIELVPTTGEVCGTVTGPAGAPITSGSITIRGGDGAPDGTGPVERAAVPLATTPAGFYKITDLAAGEYTLTATAPDDGFRDCTVVFTIGDSSPDARRRVLDLALVDSGAAQDLACTVTEGSP